MEELVWYASYGSNLLRQRFMCYIEGGTPLGMRKSNPGCTDRAPPREDRPVDIPHVLYFSGHSSSWGRGGVAFVRSDRGGNCLGRMYLITSEQFVQVVRQENGADPDDDGMAIDVSKGSHVFDERLWYGRLLVIGEVEGHPILTFTAVNEDAPLSRPPPAYVRVIASGLRECYGMSDVDIIDYLSDKGGIGGRMTGDELTSMLDF